MKKLIERLIAQLDLNSSDGYDLFEALRTYYNNNYRTIKKVRNETIKPFKIIHGVKVYGNTSDEIKCNRCNVTSSIDNFRIVFSKAKNRHYIYKLNCSLCTSRHKDTSVVIPDSEWRIRKTSNNKSKTFIVDGKTINPRVDSNDCVKCLKCEQQQHYTKFKIRYRPTKDTYHLDTLRCTDCRKPMKQINDIKVKYFDVSKSLIKKKRNRIKKEVVKKQYKVNPKNLVIYDGIETSISKAKRLHSAKYNAIPNDELYPAGDDGLTCATCNTYRNKKYFFNNGKKVDVLYNTRKCKVCCNIKVHPPKIALDITPTTLSDADIDYNQLFFLLSRLEINKGNATSLDVLVLDKQYHNIFADCPDFTDTQDTYVYMYMKVKEHYNNKIK